VLVVDPATVSVVASLRVFGVGESADVSVASDSVWVSQSSGQITRVDPTSQKAKFFNPGQLREEYLDGLAASSSMVWTTEVVRLGKPNVTGERADRSGGLVHLDIPDASEFLAAGRDGVWIPAKHSVFVSDAEPSQPIRIGVAARSAFVDRRDGSVWLLSSSNGHDQVVHLENDGTRSSTSTLPLPESSAVTLVVSNSVAWVLCDCEWNRGWIQAFDVSQPAAQPRSPRIRLTGGPWEAAADAQAVWVTAYNGGKLVRITRSGSR
jgi:hypothetical protein